MYPVYSEINERKASALYTGVQRSETKVKWEWGIEKERLLPKVGMSWDR